MVPQSVLALLCEIEKVTSFIGDVPRFIHGVAVRVLHHIRRCMIVAGYDLSNCAAVTKFAVNSIGNAAWRLGNAF